MDFQRKLKFPLYDESGDRHSESKIVEKCIISEAITGLFVSGLTERKLHQVNLRPIRKAINRPQKFLPSVSFSYFRFAVHLYYWDSARHQEGRFLTFLSQSRLYMINAKQAAKYAHRDSKLTNLKNKIRWKNKSRFNQTSQQLPTYDLCRSTTF